MAQAAGLRAALAASGPDLPVYVGMRNWSPYVADTLARMQADGVRNALALILAAHRAEASFERYIGAVDAGRAALGAGAPSVTYAGSWFDHPLFIETMASADPRRARRRAGGTAGLHGPQHPGADGRRIAVRARAHDVGPPHGARPSGAATSRSPIRVAAAGRVIPGSSPT